MSNNKLNIKYSYLSIKSKSNSERKEPYCKNQNKIWNVSKNHPINNLKTEKKASIEVPKVSKKLLMTRHQKCQQIMKTQRVI